VCLETKFTPSPKTPQGGIVKKEASLHISNVMLVEEGVAVRVGYQVDGDTKTRISKKTKK
jgi:large subunit ribosomal protein L24